jgi:hypothetical protein
LALSTEDNFDQLRLAAEVSELGNEAWPTTGTSLAQRHQQG